MSISINTVMIGGNLVRDVEIRDVGSTKVANFTIAVSKKFKGQDGQMKEKTAFIAINAWGKTAELCAQYLGKGSQAFVEGELEQDSYTDKEGKKQTKTKVRAANVQFLGERRQAAPIAPPIDDDWT